MKQSVIMNNFFQRSKARLNPLFTFTVLIPTLISILYFGLFASDVYISESQFVVRSPDKPSQSGLGVLLKSSGFANAGDEVYAAQNFIQSRDALARLDKDLYVVKAYSSNKISMFDRFNPLGWNATTEDFYDYYRQHISILHDTSSSITTLTVRAYSPDQTHKINTRLLELAEDLVNRLNERGRQDMIRFAEKEVLDSKQVATNAAVALTNFRNAKGVVDPERQAAVQLQMISKLQDELIAARTQLVQLKTYAPRSSQIPVISTQITELSRQIDDQMRQVVGDRKSLAGVAAQYQRLQLESQIADRQLAAAMASLEEAKNEARRKQAYVERIVQPSFPDKAKEPRRLRGIFVTFVMGLVFWGITSMLLAGVREHKA